MLIDDPRKKNIKTSLEIQKCPKSTPLLSLQSEVVFHFQDNRLQRQGHVNTLTILAIIIVVMNNSNYCCYNIHNATVITTVEINWCQKQTFWQCLKDIFSCIDL